MKQISLSDVAAFLLAQDNYLILSHRRPDGDTIGSCAALCRGLRSLGKQAAIYENPQFTPKFSSYLLGLTGSLSDPTVISVDMASRTLFPFGMEDAEVVLAIDHHGTNEGYAAQGCVLPQCAACGEIIWEILKRMDVSLSKEIAEAIYLAVSTDTGCFRYSNVTANTFRVASECLRAGADAYPINRAMFELKRRPRLELEAYLTQKTEFYAQGAVSISTLPTSVLLELGLTEDDIDDISGFGRKIEGVEIAAMLREVEGGMGKISLRTGSAYNAAEICSRFGGGGHAAAAGGCVPGGIEGAKKAVLTAIAQDISL